MEQGTAASHETPAPARRRPLRTGPLRDRIRRGDSYIVVFGLIVADFLAISLGTGYLEGWGEALVVIITAATLLAALRTSHVNPVLMRLAAMAVALAVLLTIIGLATGAPVGSAVGVVIAALLFGAPVAVVVRIARHPIVTTETVFGAIDVYLLIGLVFAAVYGAANAVGAQFFVQVAHPTGNQLIYFSYVTMTTLGYGDMTPATALGRSLIVIEAMMGQIYLVTVVARTVALVGQSKR